MKRDRVKKEEIIKAENERLHKLAIEKEMEERVLEEQEAIRLHEHKKSTSNRKPSDNSGAINENDNISLCEWENHQSSVCLNLDSENSNILDDIKASSKLRKKAIRKKMGKRVTIDSGNEADCSDSDI